MRLMLAHSWLPRRRKKFSGYLILYAKSKQIVSSDCFPLKKCFTLIFIKNFVSNFTDPRNHPGINNSPLEESHHIQIAVKDHCIGREYHLKEINIRNEKNHSIFFQILYLNTKWMFSFFSIFMLSEGESIKFSSKYYQTKHCKYDSSQSL